MNALFSWFCRKDLIMWFHYLAPGRSRDHVCLSHVTNLSPRTFLLPNWRGSTLNRESEIVPRVSRATAVRDQRVSRQRAITASWILTARQSKCAGIPAPSFFRSSTNSVNFKSFKFNVIYFSQMLACVALTLFSLFLNISCLPAMASAEIEKNSLKSRKYEKCCSLSVEFLPLQTLIEVKRSLWEASSRFFLSLFLHRLQTPWIRLSNFVFAHGSIIFSNEYYFFTFLHIFFTVENLRFLFHEHIDVKKCLSHSFLSSPSFLW